MQTYNITLGDVVHLHDLQMKHCRQTFRVQLVLSSSKRKVNRVCVKKTTSNEVQKHKRQTFTLFYI